MSRRTQAAIAAGLLAFSGVGAPAAVASDPDAVSEGTAEVVDGADPDSYDIGDDTVQLPDEASPAPVVASPPADDEDAAPLESAAVEPVMEAADQVTEPPPAEALPTSEPQPVAPPAAAAPTVSIAPERDGIRSERSKRLQGVRERAANTASDTSPAVIAPTDAPAPVVAQAPASPRAIRVVSGASPGQASPGDRVHTVRPGESLWSIASDLLGERATVARLAREVNRLWELNDDRVATGSPDLLYVGTRLRL